MRPVPRCQRRPGNNRPGNDVPRRRVRREAGPRLRAGPGKADAHGRRRKERKAEERAKKRRNFTVETERHDPGWGLDPEVNGSGSDARRPPLAGS